MGRYWLPGSENHPADECEPFWITGTDLRALRRFLERAIQKVDAEIKEKQEAEAGKEKI